MIEITLLSIALVFFVGLGVVGGNYLLNGPSHSDARTDAWFFVIVGIVVTVVLIVTVFMIATTEV